MPPFTVLHSGYPQPEPEERSVSKPTVARTRSPWNSRKPICLALLLTSSSLANSASIDVQFNSRSARSGKWSNPGTWAGKRTPHAGDNVQIRSGHVVTYDLASRP